VSRNLYTIAVAVPSVVSQLRELLGADPEAWLRGSGEQHLLAAAASHAPLVAFYQVILDGWSHGLADLMNLDGQTACSALQGAAAAAESTGLGVIEPAMEKVRLSVNTDEQAMNHYAIRTIASAIETASSFSEATNCPVVVLHRTLHGSFDDGEFTL
jgi:hypothetical protein